MDLKYLMQDILMWPRVFQVIFAYDHSLTVSFGVMVNLLALSVVDRGFEPRLG